MEYRVHESLSEEHVKDLYTLFQSEWWTKGRQLTDVQRMVDNSSIVIGLCHTETHELIGFTRVITDYVYKALVLDVIIKESYRGKKLGKLLLNTIIEHPKLRNVKHVELYCRPEMIPFYTKYGFTEELGELHFMRKIQNT